MQGATPQAPFYRAPSFACRHEGPRLSTVDSMVTPAIPCACALSTLLYLPTCALGSMCTLCLAVWPVSAFGPCVCFDQGAMAARYKSIFFPSGQSASIALMDTQGDAQGSEEIGASSSVDTWFALHRGAQSAGALMSIAGVAAAMSSMGAHLNHWHSRLGFAVQLMLIAQVVAGLARPPKDDVEKRRKFLMGHRVLGGLSLFFGLFCVTTGTHMAYGEPLTVWWAVVAGCILIVILLVAACEVTLASGAKSEGGVAAQPMLKSASFATFGVAGVISVVAVLSVGHFHVHL
jgi:hypothetical protein